MEVDLGCQLTGFIINYEINLLACLRGFPERSKAGHLAWVQVAGLSTYGGSRLSISIHLCFLTVDAVQPAASGCLHAFPTKVKPWATINTSFLSCFCQAAQGMFSHVANLTVSDILVFRTVLLQTQTYSFPALASPSLGVAGVYHHTQLSTPFQVLF